ncbi:MAG: hypothetical protein GF364_06940 [Candidatus Lokiarchaeota archaeon]|nr:hypothetical protein [Candidatus Lokiarchaeota archaeon]
MKGSHNNTLLITSCSNKKKKIMDPMTIRADKLYQGQFFRGVYKFTKKWKFRLAIISAKYGFIYGEEQISWYDKRLKKKRDVQALKERNYRKIDLAFKNHHRIIALMGKLYLVVLEDFLGSEKFTYAVDHQGIGGWNRLISLLNQIDDREIIENILSPNILSFSKEYLERWIH